MEHPRAAGQLCDGDVWKVIYFLLQHYKEYIKFEIYEHSNYRGVGKFQFSEKIQISPEKIDEIENYDYNKDFEHYISLIKQSKPQEKLKGNPKNTSTDLWFHDKDIFLLGTPLPSKSL